MRSFHSIVARTSREIEDAQRVRYQVYVEEEGLLPASVGVDGREVSPLDEQATTLHLLIYEGDEPVGTVRLLEAKRPFDEARFGLDLESKVDLRALALPGLVPAEVTRYCVLRRYRRTGVTAALFEGLFVESLRRGVTHWVAGANMETDVPEDAEIAYRVVIDKALASDRFRAEARGPAPALARRARPLYTDSQRSRALSGDLAGIELPPTLSLFAYRMGARFLGPPIYDAYFDVFALPLVSALADIAARRRAPSRRAA